MTRLLNRTRGTVVAERVERATSFFGRLRGLLGRSALPQGHALAIRPCTSVHTFFMRFPIDVLFLDRSGTAIRALPEVRPFRATGIHLAAAEAVELPAGTLLRTRTVAGDFLAFEDG